METTPHKKLYRVREGEMLMGVCNGIAKYLDLDVTLVRVAFLAFGAITHGGLLLAYFIMGMLMPVEGGPAVAQDWREKWRYHAKEAKQHIAEAHDEHAERVRIRHEYRYRGPSLVGQLFQILFFALVVWGIYTYLPQTQPFFDAIWRDIAQAWSWLMQKIAASN